MQRRTLLALTVVAALAATAAAPRTAHAELRIVATVPNLAAIARDVGGAHVRVTSMSLPTQDPHFVDAKPSLALELSKADLLIAVGLDLEIGWLPTLQVGARNPAILVGAPGYLECARFVQLLDVPTEKIERSQGDIHPGGNPHYLLDPRRAAAVAVGIAGRLAELDPAHAKDYAANAASFVKRLDAARARWEKLLEGARGTKIVTYHKSWVYLADWLGFEVVATLEPKPGIPPTSKHIAQVLAVGRKAGVKLVLQESYYPDKTSKLVAKKIPAIVISLPGGADLKRGESYIDGMELLVKALAAALVTSTW